MIDTASHILESLFNYMPSKGLTYEVLCTLMAEVCAIMNARPITAVSSDPDAPTVLSSGTIPI